MNEDYIIAYAIIARIAKRLGLFPDEITNQRFYRRMRSYERTICIHQIRANSKLRQVEIARIMKITSHSSIYYYENEYYDKSFVDVKFKKMIRLTA